MGEARTTNPLPEFEAKASIYDDKVSESAVSDFEGSELGTTMPPAPSFKSVLLQFLKNMATSGTDLYAMSSPAIMCNGVSVLEYCAHYCDHPEILSSIPTGEKPLDRMLVVVQWYLSSLYGCYRSRSSSGGFERKPFNPILGEQFFAEWADEGSGKTTMIAEQVSHHPPCSAFFIENKTAGVSISAFSSQKTRFTGTSIKADQTGNIFLYVEAHKEEYAVSLPEIYVRSLLTGAPFVELCGDVVIVSTNGWAAKLKFIPKPWFSGDYDQLEAIIFDTKSGKIAFDIWGAWSGRIFFREHESINNNNGGEESCDLYSLNQKDTASTVLFENHEPTGAILFDSEIMPKVPAIIKPIREQGKLESRRVWHPVTKHLKRSEFEAATTAKNKLEDHQRALRKQRAERNEEWQPSYFVWKEFFYLPKLEVQVDSPASVLSSITEADSEAGIEEVAETAHQHHHGRHHRHGHNGPFKGRWICKDFFDHISN